MSKLIVDLTHGRRYAPSTVYYRIRNEREHQRVERHFKEMGEYLDGSGILISYDAAYEIIESNAPRRAKDFSGGWDIGIKLDRWEAFAHYGYDSSNLA